MKKHERYVPSNPLFSNDALKKLLIPLLMEQCLAVMIGMADTMMVSSCGEASVSGVSLVDSINVLLIQVFSALATGGAVAASQYLGKQDREQAGIAAKQLFNVVLLSSLGIMTLCLLLRDPLLSLVFGSIEADVMAACRSYMLLSALSYPFLASYNAAAALLRAQGNAKSTLQVSVVMNLMNVAGNAITIFGLGMGVTGAGLSTLISRMAAAILVQKHLRKADNPIPAPDLFKLEWKGDMVRRILKVGVPNGLENGFFQFGKLLMVRMVSTFGTVSIAANAVGGNIATFHCLPGNAVSLAMITVIGQCVGAGDYKQARWYVRRMMTICYALMSSLNILILLANGVILKPYALSPETEYLARQIVILHGVGCVLIWPFSFTFPNALRAAGDARYTMIVSYLSMLIFRLGTAWILAVPMGYGVLAIWMAMMLDWGCRITCFLIRYHGHAW